MIIIEGADNSGKSTLANKLSEMLNIPLHHSGGPPRGVDEILLRQHSIVQTLHRGEIKIFDRMPLISDMVYGIPVRGGSPFELRFRDFVIEAIMALTVPIIYCRPPTPVLMQLEGRDQSHKKAYKTEEHMTKLLTVIPQVIKRYDFLMSEFPHITYDYTGQTSMNTLEDIVCLIRRDYSDLVQS